MSHRPRRARAAVALTALLAILAIPATSLHAQFTPRLAIGTGLALANGDLSSVSTGGGLSIAALLTVTSPQRPWGFQLDGSYSVFAAKQDGERDSHILALTANARWTVPGVLGTPYLIGGVGYYNTQGPVTGATDAERDFGVNGGIGVRFSARRIQWMIEARFHEIFAEPGPDGRPRSREFMPVTVGLVL